jgi:hypothetical protein
VSPRRALVRGSERGYDSRARFAGRGLASRPSPCCHTQQKLVVHSASRAVPAEKLAVPSEKLELPRDEIVLTEGALAWKSVDLGQRAEKIATRTNAHRPRAAEASGASRSHAVPAVPADGTSISPRENGITHAPR